MGLPLNPLTVVALSTWTYASWTMVAHHTCHGGYDRHDAQPGQDRFHGSRFALGGVLNRGRDWLDWMLPEAWNLEHNVLHHYKLGEAGDPDLVERNLDFLRVAPLPRGLKVAYVALMAGIWKWVPDLCLIWGRIAPDCMPNCSPLIACLMRDVCRIWVGSPLIALCSPLIASDGVPHQMGLLRAQHVQAAQGTQMHTPLFLSRSRMYYPRVEHSYTHTYFLGFQVNL
jgi:hypothetical protein